MIDDTAARICREAALPGWQNPSPSRPTPLCASLRS